MYTCLFASSVRLSVILSAGLSARLSACLLIQPVPLRDGFKYFYFGSLLPLV